MKCVITFMIAAALAAGMTNSTWSQGGQSGGAGTSGAAGTSGSAGAAGTSGAAGAAGTAGTAGTAGRANAAGRAQAGAGQNQFGANAQARGQIGAQGFDQMGRTPFFNDPGARRQLNMNDNQFSQLNQAYQNAYSRYNQSLNGLNQNLTPQQRAQRLQQLRAQFNQDLNTSVDSTFTSPQLRQRYNQLNLQYQGPAAFADPSVQQQLNLNNEQQLRVRQLSNAWQQQMAQFQGAGGTDSPITQQQLNTLRTQYQEQLGSILTPAQQQTWAQLVGQQYDFPVNVYSQARGNVSARTNANSNRNQQTQRTRGSANPQGAVR